MANHCWNNVVIKGKESVITTIREIFEKYESTDTFREFGDLFFPGIETFTEDYGTRWWDFEIIEVTETAINICGDSAWGPPLLLMEKIAAHYDVEVEHDFDEPGMDFAGSYEWCGDEVIKDTNMSSSQYGYSTEGAVYIVEQHIQYLEEGQFESFDNFIGSFSFDINPDDLEYLKEEYYQQMHELMDKKKALEDLKEIEIHLRNLSMESLATKVMKMHDALEFEWKEELKTDEKEDIISET